VPGNGSARASSCSHNAESAAVRWGDDCGAMVTRSSTVVFEANLIGTPTITIDLSGRDDRVPYAEMGGAVGVYERRDILPQLRGVLFDEKLREDLAQKRDEFMPAHVGPTDGKATERISSIIAGYANGSR